MRLTAQLTSINNYEGGRDILSRTKPSKGRGKLPPPLKNLVTQLFGNTGQFT